MSRRLSKRQCLRLLRLAIRTEADRDRRGPLQRRRRPLTRRMIRLVLAIGLAAAVNVFAVVAALRATGFEDRAPCFRCPQA